MARNPASAPPIGEGLRAYAEAELVRAIACFGWRGGRLHAGVHQGRKSLRRVRAVLALGGASLGPGAAWIDAGLREVCRSLSMLRDAHALAGALAALRDGVAEEDRAALGRLHRCACRLRAAAAREHGRAEPGLERSRAMLRTLLGALGTLPWGALDDEAVLGGLAAQRERAVRRRRRAEASSDDLRWHAWRRALRRLGQQQRALRACGRKRALPRLPELGLAERLGALQDLGLVIASLGRHGALHGVLDREARRRLRAFLRARLAGLRAALLREEPSQAEEPPAGGARRP